MKSWFIFLGTALVAVQIISAESAVADSESQCQTCHCSVVACTCGGKCGCGK